jgi:hypothetical protein
MAKFKILSNDKPYIRVLVEFDGLQFEQQVVSNKTGTALEEQLQSYADEYEASYNVKP